MQTHITRIEDIHRHGIYSAHMGSPLMGEQPTLHVLTHDTVFRTRAGNEQFFHRGLEAFDGRGTHRLIPLADLGIPPDPRSPHHRLTFLREATPEERELAEAEARFHSPAHLLATAGALSEAFLSDAESPALAVGIYGGLGRGDPWPGDYDMIVFVREDVAQRFLEETRARFGTMGRPVPTSCAISRNARLNGFLTEFLSISPSTVLEIERLLRGNLTEADLAREKARGNTKALWRWKKLDIQVLPWYMTPAFHRAFLKGTRDRTFLPSIRRDIQVWNRDDHLFSRERAQPIRWEY